MYANTGIIPNENTSISARSHDGIVIVELSAGSVSMSIHLDSLDVCDRLLAALTEARALRAALTLVPADVAVEMVA